MGADHIAGPRVGEALAGLLGAGRLTRLTWSLAPGWGAWSRVFVLLWACLLLGTFISVALGKPKGKQQVWGSRKKTLVRLRTPGGLFQPR